MKEATFIKALISSLSKVKHMCDGVHGDRSCNVGLPWEGEATPGECDDDREVWWVWCVNECGV